MQLRVVDLQDPDRWRWLLTDQHGGFVADHEVALVDRVGGWVGRHVVGEAVGWALVDASPVAVEVTLPAAADFLLYRPPRVSARGGGAAGPPGRELGVSGGGGGATGGETARWRSVAADGGVQ